MKCMCDHEGKTELLSLHLEKGKFLKLTGGHPWLQDALAEMEEKYRKAMVSNAQLDNEKCNLMYQVDVQKDSLTELEELLSESRREYEDKTKVL